DEAGHHHLPAVEAFGNAWGDLGLPVVGLVDRLVLRLALGLALEAADPHIGALVRLAAIAAADHHSLGYLEGDDLLLHDLDPFFHLAGAHVVLPQFVEGHLPISRLPGVRGASSAPRRSATDAGKADRG